MLVDYSKVSIARVRGVAMIAYEKPENYDHEGTHVLFVNGSVRWVNISEFNRLLAEAEKIRNGEGEDEDF